MISTALSLDGPRRTYLEVGMPTGSGGRKLRRGFMVPDPQLQNVECPSCDPPGNTFMEHLGTLTQDGRREAIFVCRRCKRALRMAVEPTPANE